MPDLRVQACTSEDRGRANDTSHRAGTLIGFRVDASSRIGTGHVRRCLSLAGELAKRRYRCVFAATELDAAAERIIREDGHQLVYLPEPNRSLLAKLVDGEPWPAAVQIDDARAFLQACEGSQAEWSVVDHYKLDSVWENCVRLSSKILAFDDLASNAHDCDLLIDQTLGRSTGDYSCLISHGCRVLAGPAFACLRPDFAARRPYALRRRLREGGLGRVLLSFGGTDLSELSLQSVLAIAPLSWLDAIDVVVGRDWPTRPALEDLAQRDRRIAIHVDTARMHDLMEAADIAIGAGGTTSWERCCLALPALTFVLAPNQADVVAALASAGASITVVKPQDLPLQLEQLNVDRQFLLRMVAAGAAICDGRGGSRVADAVAGMPKTPATVGDIQSRQATLADAVQLWLWRNDPETRATAREQEAIAFVDHVAWLERCLRNTVRTLLIYEDPNGEPVGTVRLDDLASCQAVVSITVAPGMRSVGLGRRLLRSALAVLRTRGTVEVFADIRTENVPSRKLFTSLGFRPLDTREPGFARFCLSLPRP